MHWLAKLDHRYLWHPFTQMRDWLKEEPVIIVEGKGAVLRDAQGKKYLDANSSIWTNLHGHRHPKINAALQRQLNRISHSSALGLANEPASLLGRELILAARGSRQALSVKNSSVPSAAPLLKKELSRVFYSDDGSTGMEVALKLAFEFSRRQKKQKTPRFLSLENAYHGDTLGAVSVGHIDLFHQKYKPLLFKTDKVASPYCYRCPHNRAQPQRQSSIAYRECSWECVSEVEKKFESQKKKEAPYSAMVVEPVVQGAAGMIVQPDGWLRRVDAIVRKHEAQLIADEVMTGFGRTGPLFACQRERVTPDFMVLAKGLTGGYLPMAATLTTDAVFQAFLGEYSEFKTFFHGHGYTANQLGSAAALASLGLLQNDHSQTHRQRLAATINRELESLWEFPNVGDIRQAGLVVGIELVKNWRTRQPFDLEEQAGIRVCAAMRDRGVLTRPIGNVLVYMPPYCTSSNQVQTGIRVLKQSLDAVFGKKRL